MIAKESLSYSADIDQFNKSLEVLSLRYEAAIVGALRSRKPKSTRWEIMESAIKEQHKREGTDRNMYQAMTEGAKTLPLAEAPEIEFILSGEPVSRETAASAKSFFGTDSEGSHSSR